MIPFETLILAVIFFIVITGMVLFIVINMKSFIASRDAHYVEQMAQMNKRLKAINDLFVRDVSDVLDKIKNLTKN
jgi:Tfp pilus assembly protein PilV